MAIETAKMKVRLTFTEPVLGTASANPALYDEFIASKAPDAKSVEDEIEAIGVDAVAEKGMTVFPKFEGNPIFWDYQIRGFFKAACGALRTIPGTKSSKLKAYKKEIDLRVFVDERQIPILFDGDTGVCQRPLRAQTMQGERVSLASSEEIPAGATCEFTVSCLNEAMMDTVREWLDYGKFSGLGQWRNSGKGRFYWDELAG